MGPPPLDDELDPERYPILRYLPEPMIRTLRRHFYAGVKEAEMRFPYHSADEDSVTGALGERLTQPKMTLRLNGRVYRWETVYRKLRGRGPNAPERIIGADGIFQMEVRDGRGRYLVRKGLLFQAKTEWRGSDRRLLGQASDLLAHSKSAVVIDYSTTGYTAVSAWDVVQAEGNRTFIRTAQPLAETLGDGFVGCTTGQPGLFWDPSTETLQVDNGETISTVVPQSLVVTAVDIAQ